jgi:SAM-dependent methyltransferase
MTSTDWFAGGAARHYDEGLGEWGDAAVVAATADLLVGLARGGAALEFGIGTGRIALPLADRGVAVSGIDLSPDMVAQLRAKPGGEDIPVVIGDFASTRIEGTFSLVYLVFNTIMNLTSQDAQVACFENAAAHLGPGGYFVVEVGVGDGRERLSVFDVSDDHYGIDEYDSATQALVSHHFTLREGRWELLAMPFRAASPAELDLMARLAGMALHGRWGGWTREPFTAESPKHVSVWVKA